MLGVGGRGLRGARGRSARGCRPRPRSKRGSCSRPAKTRTPHCTPVVFGVKPVSKPRLCYLSLDDAFEPCILASTLLSWLRQRFSMAQIARRRPRPRKESCPRPAAPRTPHCTPVLQQLLCISSCFTREVALQEQLLYSQATVCLWGVQG